MSVTFEGVETDEQWQHATRLAADEVQGFLLAYPMTNRELGRLFSKSESSAQTRCPFHGATYAGA